MRSPRHHRICFAACLAGAALIATSAVAGASGSRGQANVVPARQALAVLNYDTEAFRNPNRNSGSAAEVNEVRPITGERTVLPIVARAMRARTRWLEVRLPGRPNSHTGWVPASEVTVTHTRWRVLVQLSAMRVTVFRGGHVVRTFLAVVGKPSTPTPTGKFFVEEMVPLAADLSGAPFAIALSARSNVLAEFDGGPGQIALHGIANVGGTPGTAVSHGCVRLATADIIWLSEHISSGVPVTITP